ncbi:MAG: YdeI/OmpD-associated family protein [Chloroflexota bacterium]
MNVEKALYFKDSQEWRKWLEENSGRSQEVWLVHYKKNSGKTSVSLSDAVDEALCFGWIVGKLKSIDEEKYILRYSPRKPNSVWSNINKVKAENLIASGRMTPAGLARIEEAKQNSLWDGAYTNKKRDEIPADLLSTLAKHPVAMKNFENFANTYRNMYIGWVTGAKTAETRQKRIIEVVRRTSLNKKPGID